MGASEPNVHWAIADAYEPFVGRWSSVVAQVFVPWLAVATGGRWLDVGCGTGALSRVILDMASPREVVGIDPSPGFVAYARHRTPSRHVHFAVGDAQALPIQPSAFDVTVSGLVLNFVPNPSRALVEMAQLVRPGGVVGAYVWDYSGGMELLRRFWDAAATLDPSARAFDEGRRFAAVCSPDGLTRLFSEATLRNVEARAVDVATRFQDFEDFWTPFLGNQGPAPAYAATLSAEHLEALRECLRADLPSAIDGSISLRARAWAVRGER